MKAHTVLVDNCVGLFPGQGSISPGAGEAWRSSSHWGLTQQISHSAGVDVEQLLLFADHDTLVRTDNAQLATFALSLIAWSELADTGKVPRYLIGHSLGEFSALVAAGVLTIDDGARLIAARGAAMRQATALRPGSMVALMGGDNEAQNRLRVLPDVWVANINGQGQIVVSGTTEGLSALIHEHRELGFRRATPLPVGGAFHCPLMSPAQGALDQALEAVSWAPTEHTVFANVDGTAHFAVGEWRELLSRQLTSPVDFLRATESLPGSVSSSIEMPPGAVLTGLTKRIRTFERQISLANPADVEGAFL